MTKQLKHKRSIGERLRDHCTTAMHSLKQISSAVLMHGDEDNDVDELFDSDNDDNGPPRDFVTALKKESKTMANFKIRSNPMTETATATTTTATVTHSMKSTSATSEGNDANSLTIDSAVNNTVDDNANSAAGILRPDGSESWEKQRIEWLEPTVPASEITRRKQCNALHRLSSTNDDVYVGIYKNLVVYGKPLKKGLNMTDGFKVIYAGWESTKMFERVANGGVP